MYVCITEDFKGTHMNVSAMIIFVCSPRCIYVGMARGATAVNVLLEVLTSAVVAGRELLPGSDNPHHLRAFGFDDNGCLK